MPIKGCYANAKAHGLCTGHLDQRSRGKELLGGQLRPYGWCAVTPEYLLA
jgi:hypothetical protein